MQGFSFCYSQQNDFFLPKNQSVANYFQIIFTLLLLCINFALSLPKQNNTI